MQGCRDALAGRGKGGLPCACLGQSAAEFSVGRVSEAEHEDALAALPLTLICAIIFFAGGYNKAFVALCLLCFAPLCTLMLLGPGLISLDFKRSQRAARRFFRG